MSNKMIPPIYVGTSAWNYSHWKDVFYPSKYAKSQWLQFYAQNFTTVEVNATFYRLPKPETFENWRHWAQTDSFSSINRSISFHSPVSKSRSSAGRNNPLYRMALISFMQYPR